MRVIRTSGSEGGAAQTVPTPIAARRLASEGALSATTDRVRDAWRSESGMRGAQRAECVCFQRRNSARERDPGGPSLLLRMRPKKKGRPNGRSGIHREDGMMMDGSRAVSAAGASAEERSASQWRSHRDVRSESPHAQSRNAESQSTPPGK